MTTETNQTREEMLDMTIADLIGVHNALAEATGDNDLKSWKKAKAGLVDKIEEMRAELEAQIEEQTLTDDESAKLAQYEPPEQSAPADDQSDADEEPKRTIKSAALEALCEVAYYENREEKYGDDNRVDASHPKAQSVGIPYAEVLQRIVAEFPGADTSVACLRWYSVKVRAEEFGYEGLRLPQRRPRAKPTPKAEG